MEIGSRQTLAALAVAGILVSSCVIAGAQPACTWVPYQMATPCGAKALAILHCQARIVEDAVELSAIENVGVFEASVAGFTSMLPRPLYLENVATGARTEPVDGMSWQPGSIGYTPISQLGVNVGYQIWIGTYILSDEEVNEIWRSKGPPTWLWMGSGASSGVDRALPHRK